MASPWRRQRRRRPADPRWEGGVWIWPGAEEEEAAAADRDLGWVEAGERRKGERE
jgi:hypothetical protein